MPMDNGSSLTMSASNYMDFESPPSGEWLRLATHGLASLAMAVTCVAVDGWEDTADKLDALIARLPLR